MHTYASRVHVYIYTYISMYMYMPIDNHHGIPESSDIEQWHIGLVSIEHGA